MKRSMLDYTKEVLEKVSFDRELFNKEIKKAMDYLMEHEVRELEQWCVNRFGPNYCFSTAA